MSREGGVEVESYYVEGDGELSVKWYLVRGRACLLSVVECFYVDEYVS